MINSKVIRKGRKHISRADYESTPVILDSINVKFPRITTVEARALRRLFPAKRTLSHREFDRVSHTYCLRGCIDRLRYKGWTIVNHDEVIITKDPVPRKAMFTRYELFATPTPELQERIRLFCKAVDEFEVDAASTTASTQNKAV
jgi:hypothetical protein